ncbi:hypothetical protein QYE76_029428 [Lolium multiflorum]|uniref:Uncharacterized protein n=1 Tax=Lolium multiflorum TaxID=4521 RepID=A0AAD8QNW5_LOLMU|nr:hypothetical protein QYE76_029428 [Lolium multiflorum]
MAAKGWGKSKVTRESLLPYVASGVIPEFNKERWRVPPANEVEPLPRPGEFVLFLSFLDRGFALPTSDFLRQLLAFYNIKVPTSGRTASNRFLCEVRESFIDMALPKKAQSPCALVLCQGVHSSGEVCIPRMPRAKRPRRLNVRSPPREQEEVVKEMRQAIQARR